MRDLMREVSYETATLPAAPLRALIPVLAHAERELTKDLAELVQDFGGGRYSAQMLRRALVQVRGALNAVEQLRPEMRNALVAGGRQAGTMATRHLQRELAMFSRIFGGTIQHIPVVPAAKLAQQGLVDRYAASAKAYTAEVRADIRHQLSLGLARGESFPEMTARLMGRRTVAGIAAVAEMDEMSQARAASAAIFRTAQWKAERIVRTEVMNVYNESARESIQEVAEDEPRIQKRWDAILDGRVCLDCRQLHGVSVAPDENFPVPGDEGPPLHPYCRCTTVIWRSDWGDKEGVAARKGMVKLEGWPEEGVEP